MIVGGIAFYEYLMLVFFWHSIYSFLIPVLAFETISRGKFGNHDRGSILSNSLLSDHPRITKSFFLGSTLVGMILLSANNGNPVVIIGAILGNFGIIYGIMYFAGRRRIEISLKQITLQRKGMILVIYFVLVYYLITFFTWSPELLPDYTTPYLIIVGSAFVFSILFYLSPESQNNDNLGFDFYPNMYRNLKWSWITAIILAILSIVLIGIYALMLLPFFLFLLFSGILIFATSAKRVLYSKNI